MEYTEACLEMVKIIQANAEEYYPDSLALMIATFCEEMNNGESPAMALSLARTAISEERQRESGVHIDQLLADEQN